MFVINILESLALTSNNQYLASASCDNTIRVWNLENAHQEYILEGHRKGVYSIAITSDDRYLVSGSMDATIRVWNLPENPKRPF